MLVDGIVAAGLDDFAYTHAVGQPWPTLGEMIDAGTRIIFAVSHPRDAPAWLKDERDLVFGTPCCAADIDELDCHLESAPIDDGIFFVSHTLTNPLASPELAAMVNGRAFTEARVEACEIQHGRLPTFLSIDFYRTGEALEAVEALDRARFGP